MRFTTWTALMLVAALGGRAAAQDLKSTAKELSGTAPVVPAEASSTFRSLDGFRLELLAAEPLLADPVALEYDERGRAWVVEMGDYPYSDKQFDRPYEEQQSLPLGRVRVLEDTDGDGRFDRGQVFADELSWPTGLALWNGGVFVTATPDLLYLRDTDGDGRADERRVVYTGFRKFNVQAVMNNPRWGLDGWLYVAGGSNGGAIRRPDESAERAVRLSRNDFRFEPRAAASGTAGPIELLTGGARFGHSLDDWGGRFLCNIRNPVQHVALEDRYLGRNPLLPLPSGLHDAAPAGAVEVLRASPPEPWRVLSAERRSADPDDPSPLSERKATGYVTSSSGITLYRGTMYPDDYAGNAFVAEVAGNMVLRYRLHDAGPSYTAERVHGEFEFVASTDNWFRPVNFSNGPDGALHVVDMYRETIEHPWSIPDDIKARLDLRSGHDRGRIYRLLPAQPREGFTPPPAPRLGADTPLATLVELLASPEGWWRDTAQRLLLERSDLDCLPALRRLAESGESIPGRLHALATLDALGALEAADVLGALADPSPRIREHALRLAERRLVGTAPRAGDSRLVERVLGAAEDADRRVRYQAALTIGWLDHARVAPALLSMLSRDAEDSWCRAAVLTAVGPRPLEFLRLVLGRAEVRRAEGGRAVCGQLAYLIGAGREAADAAQVARLAAEPQLAGAADRELQIALLQGLGDGLRRGGRSLRAVATDGGEAAQAAVARFLQDAASRAVDDQLALEARTTAVQRLSLADFESARSALTSLLDPRQPQELQVLAVATLGGFRDSTVAPQLLAAYPRLTPQVRKAVVDALLARSERLPDLLAAVERREVESTLIPPTRRTLLEQHADPQVSELAKRLFAADAPGPRNEVVARYQQSLQLAGDVERGAVVFRRECQTCHRLGGTGHDVGPNLATIRHRSPGELVVQILDPNREVSPHFREYVVRTVDGELVQGIIAAETAASVTLRAAEAKERTVLRQDIEEISGSGKSLMPEGLEAKVTPQELADLLRFLLETR